MAVLLDGDALARRLRAGLADRVADLAARGLSAKLATVLVGDDPASRAYVERKHADCRALGIGSREILLPAGVAPARLADEIAALNADPGVTGLLVQLPLPGGLDAGRFTALVRPDKDVDGIHPVNLGRLVAGKPGILPCTPAAILALLRHHAVPLAGRRLLIVGRGALVGRPLAMLASLKGIDATVTLAHRGSGDLFPLACEADVIVAAAGVPGLVTAPMVKPGAAVVGVGISYRDGAMVSDIAPGVAAVAGWVTPPHGSVGPLTRAMLLANLLDLAEGRARTPGETP